MQWPYVGLWTLHKFWNVPIQYIISVPVSVCSSSVFHFLAASTSLFFVYLFLSLLSLSVFISYPPSFCPCFPAFSAFIVYSGGQVYRETYGEDLKIAGWGVGEGFRVNIDKWVCRVSRGSGEHRQLGQHFPKGNREMGFLPAETPGREREGAKQRWGCR